MPMAEISPGKYQENHMSQSQQAVRQIALKTDEANFYKNLGSVFSDKTKVLAELIQNSRRAGATAIHFKMEDGTLVIEDNGQGISDLQSLLIHSHSDWSEELKTEERSFGVGFLSTLYAAKQVKVESRGKMCLLDTASVIALNPVDEFTTDYIGNTRISLIEFALDHQQTRKALIAIVKGFPVPVFLNGEELPRPEALDNLAGIVTMAIGQGLLRNADHEKSDFYYQGLPVKSPFVQTYLVHTRNVIHLDNSFSVRMPDRDALINPDDAAPIIAKALREAWIENLHLLKTSISAAEFVLQYGNLKSFDLLHLLNDVPLLPASIINSIPYYPTEKPYEYYMSASDTNIAYRDIKDGKSILVNNLEDCQDGHAGMAFALMTMMYREDWLILKEKLHPDHWIYQEGLVIDLAKAKIAVDRTPLLTSWFNFAEVSGNLELVESITIRVNDHAMTYKDMNVGLSEGEWANDFTLIITNNSDDVLLQVHAFSEEDEYREDWFYADNASLTNLIAVLKGEKSETSIVKSLREADIIGYSNCQNTATVVVIKPDYPNVTAFSLESILSDFAQQLGIEVQPQRTKEFLEQLQHRQMAESTPEISF
jgi:hypothetical protein